VVAVVVVILVVVEVLVDFAPLLLEIILGVMQVLNLN
tara:strand:+ start:1228 stop:1338 length:111 start_codon:yes stop_codon:yes gene_type:complete